MQIQKTTLKSVEITNNKLETTGKYVVYINGAKEKITISNNRIKQNNISDETNPASFALSNIDRNCTINLFNNSVQANNAMLLNSWNCSKETSVNLSGNSFNAVSKKYGNNRLSLSGMIANYN